MVSWGLVTVNPVTGQPAADSGALTGGVGGLAMVTVGYPIIAPAAWRLRRW